MTWTRACALEDVDADTGYRWVPPDSSPIAIFLVDGAPHALEDTCTHGQASLVGEGYLDGPTVECGLHQGSFDVRTGKAIGWPCTVDLQTYTVRVVDGGVLVDLPRQA